MRWTRLLVPIASRTQGYLTYPLHICIITYIQGCIILGSHIRSFFSLSSHKAKIKVKKKCGDIKNYRQDGPERQSRLVGSTMCNAGLLSCLREFLSARKPAKVSMKKKRGKGGWKSEGEPALK